jgi:hypothetical protein
VQRFTRAVDGEGVTLPRPVFADDTVMAQKRCYRGEFRLRPDADTQQAYLFALGYCQDKYKVLLHDFIVASNHDHNLMTDPDEVGPLFIGLVHSLVARSLNRRHRESDKLWSGQRHSAPRLLDTATVLEKNSYVLTNAVKHGLVRYAWDWPGVTSWYMEYGVPKTIKRPDFFFSEGMPEEVQVTITRPPGLFPELNDREARAKVREHARAEQSRLLGEFKKQGRTFLGPRRVLRQSRHDAPKKGPKLGGIRPHVATRDAELRAKALKELKDFWRDHEAARLAFREGHRDVEFPPGTYLMKKRHKVRIRPPP